MEGKGRLRHQGRKGSGCVSILCFLWTSDLALKYHFKGGGPSIKTRGKDLSATSELLYLAIKLKLIEMKGKKDGNNRWVFKYKCHILEKD